MNREIGRKYGHLTVVEDTGRRYHGSIIFRCRCDCGNFKDVSSNKLHSGHVISCGCRNKENQPSIYRLRTGFLDGTSVTAIEGRRANKFNSIGSF